MLLGWLRLLEELIGWRLQGHGVRIALPILLMRGELGRLLTLQILLILHLSLRRRCKILIVLILIRVLIGLSAHQGLLGRIEIVIHLRLEI